MTYLEFVRADTAPTPDVRAGDGMIAFNAEAAGSIDWLV